LRVLAGLEIAIPQNPLWVFSPMIDQLYSTNVLQFITIPPPWKEFFHNGDISMTFS